MGDDEIHSKICDVDVFDKFKISRLSVGRSKTKLV